MTLRLLRIHEDRLLTSLVQAQLDGSTWIEKRRNEVQLCDRYVLRSAHNLLTSITIEAPDNRQFNETHLVFAFVKAYREQLALHGPDPAFNVSLTLDAHGDLVRR